MMITAVWLSLALSFSAEEPTARKRIVSQLCEKNEAVRLSAEFNAKKMRDALAADPDKTSRAVVIPDIESVRVGNIGPEDGDCDIQWQQRAINESVKDAYMSGSCGVILTFKNEEALKSFANFSRLMGLEGWFHLVTNYEALYAATSRPSEKAGRELIGRKEHTSMVCAELKRP